MIKDTYIQHGMAFDSGALSTYLKMPYACTLKNVTGIVQADPGDNETVTFTGGGSVASGASGATTTLGVLTFGSGVAAGADGTWVGDATNGNMTLLSGSWLKTTTSAAAAAVCDLNIELDPHGRDNV